MSSRAAAARLIGAAHKIVTVLVVTGLVLAWLTLPGSARVAAQSEEEPEPALLLIMDSSGSMNGSDGSGGTKIQAAKAALNGVVNALPDDSQVGLRVYGHRIPNTDERRGCKDTQLVTPVGPLDRGGMKQQIRSFERQGFHADRTVARKGGQGLTR
jgi:Ca-activated chloride channel family protein